MKTYYVHIMSNQSHTLYVGVTNNLERRVYEHKQKLTPGFTSRYNITKLVYYAETDDVREAIARKGDKGLAPQEEEGVDRGEQPLVAEPERGLVEDWYSEGGKKGALGGEGRDSSLRSE